MNLQNLKLLVMGEQYRIVALDGEFVQATAGGPQAAHRNPEQPP